MSARPSPAALAGAARDRATVRLTDGRTATLVYYPLPLEERRARAGKRRTAAQAKVMLGGRHRLVAPELVEEVLADV